MGSTKRLILAVAFTLAIVIVIVLIFFETFLIFSQKTEIDELKDSLYLQEKDNDDLSIELNVLETQLKEHKIFSSAFKANAEKPENYQSKSTLSWNKEISIFLSEPKKKKAYACNHEEILMSLVDLEGGIPCLLERKNMRSWKPKTPTLDSGWNISRG